MAESCREHATMAVSKHGSYTVVIAVDASRKAEHAVNCKSEFYNTGVGGPPTKFRR